MATKLELERALQKLNNLDEKVSHEQNQREELTTLVHQLEELNKVLKDEMAKQKVALNSVVEECKLLLGTQLKDCTSQLEVCRRENACKAEEIAHLKEFTPDMHAQEAIDSANRQLLLVED